MSARLIEAEWLDTLPAHDPRAMRSRRDLRRVNQIMLQAGIMRRMLRAHCRPRPPRSILELGCGDGTFMLRLARTLAPHWCGVEVTLVDRQEIVSPATREAFLRLGWRPDVVGADVFDFLEHSGGRSADIVTANLFLHHFSGVQLSRLLSGVAALAPLFIACEPRRSPLALAGSRLLWALGCNDVSRHDATASVRAGFGGNELSTLWPGKTGWKLFERHAWPFTHCFVAQAGKGGGTEP